MGGMRGVPQAGVYRASHEPEGQPVEARCAQTASGRASEAYSAGTAISAGRTVCAVCAAVGTGMRPAT